VSRAVALAGLLMVLHSLPVHADPVEPADDATDALSPRVVDAADTAGVEPLDLAGAVATTGLDPFEYLYAVGELQRPVPKVTESAQCTGGCGVWDRLAQCEASGDWHSASNPRYKGGIQADATFWARYGGLAFASSADRASREQQIVVGQRGLEAQGPTAWPVCGPRVGLHR
jgi:hypothetical protein